MADVADTGGRAVVLVEGAPHEFPPSTNPGIFWCRHCGLVTNRRRVEPCASRPPRAE